MPSLLILLPFLGFVVLNLPFKSVMKRVSFWLVAALAIFQIVISATHPAAFRNFAQDPFIRFFSFHFAIDRLTLVALFSIGIVSLTALLTARVMMRDDTQKFNFINLLLLAMVGMNVISMSTDLFSIYVFIEVTAISSFILIALNKDALAIEGAFKYIMLSSIATVLILCSLGLLLLFCGGTSFTDISAAFKNSNNELLFKIALGLFLCGLFVKAGMAPFHGWLPDAYSSASAPVSVLLAGIVTKVCGVYMLIRLVVSVPGAASMVRMPLMFIGTASIIIGAMLSLTQNNFKRLLAYSSISQVGYIILAAGCGTPLAIFGAGFHFFNHAIFKTLLFVNAAAVENQTGTLDMNKMGGLAVKMPVTGTTSIIAFLSAAGIPPLAGFWSKLIIVIALWSSGNVAYALIALLAGIITLGYFLYLQRRVFFGKLQAGLENIKEAPAGLLAPQVILAAIILFVGLIFPVVMKWK